jgi:3-hydroxyisobutyrate dehydrogenase-like beta-hydroxyacid dehydrogenase
MTTPDLGFVGLGTMGASMARRLLAQGWKVTVTDVRADAVDKLVSDGAQGASTPAEVAEQAEVVFASLPSPAILLEVISGSNGLLQGSRMRSFVDVSTTGPVVGREAGARLAAAGIGFIDSPVSGGPTGAVDGTLTMMASGPKALLDELDPYIRAIGSNIIHVGEEAGQGQLAKVINNLLGAASIAVVGEALALGVKGGLDPSLLLDVINSSSGRSSASQGVYPKFVLPRTFNLGFRLRLEAKDVALCLEEANRQKVPMMVSSAVAQLWSIANSRASEEDDFTSIALMIEEWAGVTLKSSD